MIVGVAAKTKSGAILILMRPARHCHFSAAYNEKSRAAGWNFPWRGWPAEMIRHVEHGFITSTGQFLSRKSAAEYAYRTGQTVEPKDLLCSEDLW